MQDTKTKLYHTCPTEEPFQCMTGELAEQGLLVVVDKSTHELVVRYGAEEGTITVLVNPKGAQVQGVSVRSGTRLLDLDASSSDPMRQAGESIEELRRTHLDQEIAESARRGVDVARWGRRGAIGAPQGSIARVLPESEN